MKRNGNKDKSKGRMRAVEQGEKGLGDELWINIKFIINKKNYNKKLLI
jgi:hypothetical protein